MMKSFFALALTLSTSAALADGLRPISTKNLNCTGKAKTGDTISLEMTSDRSGGHIVSGGFSDYATKQFTVSSEGSTYIQVLVNNRLNLILWGQALENVLEGPIGTTAVDLTGQISFVNGETFELSCKGDLTSEQFGLGQRLDGLEGLE